MAKIKIQATAKPAQIRREGHISSLQMFCKIIMARALMPIACERGMTWFAISGIANWSRPNRLWYNPYRGI